MIYPLKFCPSFNTTPNIMSGSGIEKGTDAQLLPEKVWESTQYQLSSFFLHCQPLNNGARFFNRWTWAAGTTLTAGLPLPRGIICCSTSFTWPGGALILFELVSLFVCLGRGNQSHHVHLCSVLFNMLVLSLGLSLTSWSTDVIDGACDA